MALSHGKSIASSSSTSWWKRLAMKAPALFGLLLLVAAVVIMWREVQHLSLHDIFHSLHQIPEYALWEGAGVTIVAYFILSFYDGLACRHVGAALSWKRSAFVAFCSYVLSHNLGCAAISGTAVRYRLYSGWGVSGSKIAGIVAFCSLTYLLGTIGLVGFVFLWQPGAVPFASHMPLWVPHLVGCGCYLVLVAYVGLALWKRDFSLGRWHIELPDWKTGLVQIIVSMADMSITALIAWCVVGPLPPGSTLTFDGFLAIYIVAYTAGLAASVPGGLGVFDSAMLLALSPWLPVPRIMSAVLIFRLFYYIIPLILAGLMFVGHELFLRGIPFLPRYWPNLGNSAVIRESEADFSVGVATGVQVLLGIVTIAYTLVLHLPSFHSTAEALLVQAAVFLLMLCGVILVGLAAGLLQRVALAWRLSIIVHCISLPLLLICHCAWVGFVIVLAVMLMLITFRGCYYRQAHWRVAPLSPAILAPLSLWLAGLAGMGWIAHKRHLGPIWWRAMIHDSHTAKGRWFLAGAVLCCVVALCCAVRRTRLQPFLWNEETSARYTTLSGLSFPVDWPGHLVPDGAVSDETGRAVMAFAYIRPFILALDVPVGLERCYHATIWRLRDYAEQESCCLAILQETTALSDVYSDIGLSHFQIAGYHLFCEIEHYGKLFLLLQARGVIDGVSPVPLSFRAEFLSTLRH